MELDVTIDVTKYDRDVIPKNIDKIYLTDPVDYGIKINHIGLIVLGAGRSERNFKNYNCRWKGNRT